MQHPKTAQSAMTTTLNGLESMPKGERNAIQKEDARRPLKTAGDGRRCKKEREEKEMLARLDHGKSERSRYETKIFESDERVRSLRTDLGCLQAIDDEEFKGGKAKNS
jgi:hypothetical protein